MKRVFSLLTLIAFLLPVVAQEAKIMIVEKPDSQKLSRAYREYKDALKRWDDAKTEIATQYTQEKGKVIPGWEKVQFSADFRAIVPVSSPYAGYQYPCNVVAASWPLTGTSSSVLTGTGNVSIGSPVMSTDIVGDLVVKEKH